MIDPQSNVESLLEAAKANDVASLELLLLKYYDQLVAHVRSNFSDADLRRGEAEDIVQQTHQRVFKSIVRFRGSTSQEFCGWLHRICDNILTDSRRSHNSAKRSGFRTRISFESTDTHLTPLWTDLCDPGSTSATAIKREERAQVESALRKLTREEFELIQMRYIDQKSPTEIAQTTGKSRSAIVRKCVATIDRMRRLIGTAPESP